MNHLYLLAAFLLAAVIPLYLYRIVRGPEVFDRLIGLNGIASKAILLLLLIGLSQQRLEMFIDICIGYGLLNLVGSLAVAKYLEKRALEP